MSSKEEAPDRIYIVPNLHEPGTWYREWITDAGNSPRRQSVPYIRADLLATKLQEKDAEQRKLIQYFEDKLSELRANQASEIAKAKSKVWDEIRPKIVEAMRLIHADEPEGNYQGGMEILCKLTGYVYPSVQAMKSAKPVTIQEVAARTESKGDSNAK